jgi:ATP-binding cassette subfamily B protein
MKATAKDISVIEFVKKLNDLLFIDKTHLVNVYIYSILASIVSLSLPLGIQAIIGFVMAGTYSTSIFILISLVIFGTFISGLLQVRQLQIIETLEQKIFVKYTYAYTGILPSLDFEKYRRYNFPEYVNRFFEVVSLQKGLKKILIDIPTAMIQIGISLLLLSFYHPVFIALGVLLLAVLFMIFYFTFKRGLILAYNSSENKYQIIAWIEEVARALNTFKMQRHKGLSVSKVDDKLKDYLTNKTNYFNVLLTQVWSMISFKTLITAAMLLIGTYLLVNQKINVGQFIAADIVIISVMNSVEKLIISLDNIYETLVSTNKLNKLLYMDDEQSSGFEVATASIDKFKMEFKQVSYKYDDYGNIIDNINLSINKGEFVLLRGKSGKGKSLILKLILGIYKSYQGSILLNDVDLRNYNVFTLREKVSLLMSDQDIIEGTLLENIVMDEPNVSVDFVQQMAVVSGLADFMLANHLDYQQVIGINSSVISKAARSRILLTRILVSNRKIVLLEEPMTFLTNDCVDRLMEYFKQKKITLIMTSEFDKFDGFFDKVYDLDSNKLIKG